MIDKKIKSRARRIPTDIIVGKRGLKEGMIIEIKRHLKEKKLVKVKFLKSAIEDLDKKKVFSGLAEKTNSELVYSVGFTVTLYRK